MCACSFLFDKARSFVCDKARPFLWDKARPLLCDKARSFLCDKPDHFSVKSPIISLWKARSYCIIVMYVWYKPWSKLQSPGRQRDPDATTTDAMSLTTNEIKIYVTTRHHSWGELLKYPTNTPNKLSLHIVCTDKSDSHSKVQNVPKPWCARASSPWSCSSLSN